jgi:tRNA(fMet)-specific endonuclease VapC
MIIADTDVLIDFLNDREPAAARVAGGIERGELATTAVNRFELMSGASSSAAENSLRGLFEVVPTLVLDAGAADRAALVRRSLQASGKAIGMGDSLIAGIALQHGGLLLTRNRRHFERVEGLRLAELDQP